MKRLFIGELVLALIVFFVQTPYFLERSLAFRVGTLLDDVRMEKGTKVECADDVLEVLGLAIS